MIMKGSQGLEALATLCGGASKAIDESNSRRNDKAKPPSQDGNQPLLGRQFEQFSNASLNINGSNNNKSNTPQPQSSHMLQQINPQLAALLSAGLTNQPPPSNDGALALQQMLYLNLLQQNQNQNHSNSNLFNPQQQLQQTQSPQLFDQNALTMMLALQAQQESASSTNRLAKLQQQQHEQPQAQQFAQSSNFNTNNFTQPKVKNDVATVHQPILMRHPQSSDSSKLNSPSLLRNDITQDEDTRERSNSESFSFSDDKKLMKRAANRRSAQLSRKRKKQYIEDLKDENSDLRRMELILRSIPDLVVSFDSSGKIGFVSQSVCKFLSFTPDELEGKSFWERLCEESVRLLKAAFMDALAARESDSTSTPLGNGVWELRLQDKNKEIVKVTLNGVVHFTGDAPECVCSIRLSEGKRSSLGGMKPVPPPQQSVFDNNDGKRSLNATTGSEQGNDGQKKNPRLTAQISDADSSNGSNLD